MVDVSDLSHVDADGPVTDDRVQRRYGVAMDAPQAPPGWHTDPQNPSQLRYWDGQSWTEHTAPVDAPPPPVAPKTAPGEDEETDEETIECAYCTRSISSVALRCEHCGGDFRYCKRCDDLVGVTSRQKFVGLLRGGTKTQYNCIDCGYTLDGPRW